MAPWCEDSQAPPTLGMYGRVISTPLTGVVVSGVDEVDEMFAQGLAQEWNFNQVESRRNMEWVVSRAPNCAVCWWGLGRTHMANINRAANLTGVAIAARRAASTLHPSDGPKVQALVSAIQRLIVPDEANRSAIAAAQAAYGEAICASSVQSADDPDLGALCADAIMTQSPWAYHVHSRMADGPGPLKPALESIGILLARLNAPSASPHPLAQHLQIHLTEPLTGTLAATRMGQEAADALEGRLTSAGHLQHMPAHLYLRTGRWRDGLAASKAALVADARYLNRCLCPCARPCSSSVLPFLTYRRLCLVHCRYAHSHNIDMGIWHALLLGNEAAAIKLARQHATDAAAYRLQSGGGGVACHSDGVSTHSAWLSLVHTRFGR